MNKIITFLWEHFIKEFLKVVAGTLALMGVIWFVLGPFFGLAWLGDEGHIPIWLMFTGVVVWMMILCGVVKWIEENSHGTIRNFKKGS